MRVTLHNVSKRFDREWILKKVNYEFVAGQSYAVLGPNGSGKSTLMQLIAGNLTATDGNIEYGGAHGTILVDDIYQYLGICAPYLQLIEEFTLREQLEFHLRFKNLIGGVKADDLVQLLMLEKAADKEIRNYSSGMKQRVKLALSLLSDVPMILLDEPATNLDADGVAWYRKLVDDHLGDRLLIVSSNRPDEYDFCTHQLQITDFK